MMKNKKLITILTLLSSSLQAEGFKTITNYDYIFDNENYLAHQIQNILKTVYADFTHVYYDATDRQNHYSYNQALITTSFVGDNWSIVLGPGIISSSEGHFTPGYSFIGDYQPNKDSNIELSAERSPIMAASFGQGDNNQVDRIADYVSDNITLSYEYQITEKFDASIGVLTQQISDGNARYGVFDKFHYQINDNWGIQMRNKITWMDENSPEYFSPLEMQRHWLLLTYTRPILNDNVVLKLAAGPGITKIDDRTEGTWIVEAKAYTNISKDVRIETHANCSSSAFDYEMCSVGAQINIKF
jgi:hypothetical protein